MKYMGSKSRVAKWIAPILQKAIDTHEADYYFEPFCGGCNMLDKIVAIKRYGCDYNKYLIALLKYVQDGPAQAGTE